MPLPFTARKKVSNLDLLSFTLDNPSYNVNQPIFIDPSDPSSSLSHTQTLCLIRRLIAGMRSAGLKSGDAVCLHSFNSIIYPVLCLAIVGAGGIFVGTNPSYTELELTHALSTTRVKFIFSEPDIMENMQKAMASAGITNVERRLFVLDYLVNQAVPTGFQSWRHLCRNGEKDWIRFDDEAQQTRTAAAYFFTSGTMGLPKCAVVSHRNLVAQHQLFWETSPRAYQISTIHVFPLYHIGAFPTVVVSQLKDGRQAYIMRRFKLEPFLSYHERFGITEVFMAPPMVTQVVMSGLADLNGLNYNYSLKSVRRGYVGAAPLSADMQKRFHRLLSDRAQLTQIWGMTETTSPSTTVPDEVACFPALDRENSWGSIGKPLPEIQIKLVDDKGNDITDQERGEACVRGPNVVCGYLDNEKANHEGWDTDGYFRSGDIMQVDAKTGLLYVVERKKELIKVRGFQVAPAELEGILVSHPDITDAAVIGIPDEHSGELPRAYVVLREGAFLSEHDIKTFMRKTLAGYKFLDGGVVVVDQIPKLPSGKILKRVIREWNSKGKTEAATSKL